VALESTPELSARFTFVTPNLCNDMHDCSVNTSDSWLASFLPKVFASARYQAGRTSDCSAPPPAPPACARRSTADQVGPPTAGVARSDLPAARGRCACNYMLARVDLAITFRGWV
jgi:hypothetical protein